MEEIRNKLKWIVPGQLIGLIVIFLSQFIPLQENLRQGLFIFGFVVTFAYWIDLFKNIYLTLKNKK